MEDALAISFGIILRIDILDLANAAQSFARYIMRSGKIHLDVRGVPQKQYQTLWSFE